MRKTSPSSPSRASARIDAVVRYRGATEGVLCVARCRELSTTGLTAHIDRPLHPGELVRFDLERGPGGPSVLGLARVSWVGSDPDGADSIMRLRFLRLSEASQALVGSWIDEVSAVAQRPSQPADDSSVRALGRAIADSLTPPVPNLGAGEPAPAPPITTPPPASEPRASATSGTMPAFREVLITPPPQIPSTPVPGAVVVPPPPRPSAAMLAQRLRANTPSSIPPVSFASAASARVSLSPPLPLGALIDAPPSSARRSTPPGLRATTVPPPPPPAGAYDPDASAKAASIPAPDSDVRERPSAARATPAPAQPITDAPRASIPIGGPSLPDQAEPWSVQRKPAHGRWSTRAWLLLCLASVCAGAALAYFVYEPSVWLETLVPIETPMHVGHQPRPSAPPPATQVPEPAALAEPAALEPSTATTAPAAKTAEPKLDTLARVEAPVAAPVAPSENAPAPVAQNAPATGASLGSPLALLGRPVPADAAPRGKLPAKALTAKGKKPPTAAAPVPVAAPAPAAVPTPPPQPTAAATPAVEPTPVAPASRLTRARQCLAKGDNGCAIALLEQGASSEAELELWIETLRAEGRSYDARKQMQRYMSAFPNGRRAATYRRILQN